MDECNEDLLLDYGVLRVPLPKEFDRVYWATTLSTMTPMIMAGEGDGDYAFYRNILEEPDFPFEMLMEYFASVLSKHFDVSVSPGHEANNTHHVDDIQPTTRHKSFLDIRLDDAFCVHYNMNQEDTSGAKHTDPSDITVNMCLETSDDFEGSLVRFHGTQSLAHPIATSKSAPPSFLVKQKQGYATLHWGHHPHETTPLIAGQRTNIILTYCYRDPSKSNAADRSCYFP